MNLGNTRLTSITGYQWNEVQRSEDNDGGPLSLTDLYYEAETDQLTQELRVASIDGAGRHQWVAVDEEAGHAAFRIRLNSRGVG